MVFSSGPLAAPSLSVPVDGAYEGIIIIREETG